MENINNINGGKAIDSGGFGCVFLPSLKCLNSNDIEKTTYISKLSFAKDAIEEYNNIENIKSKLQIIPNYHNYFLVNNFKLCSPDKLTTDDLINYDEKCDTLIEDNITTSNINNNLDKIKILNMPFGGINIKKYMKKNFNSDKLIKLNNLLINLLVNGIVPMNKTGVYHGDLKASNVLVNEDNDGKNSVKIIDWGMSFIYENSNDIPKNVNRPIQFNLPVSVVVFGSKFNEKLENFISKNSEWNIKKCKIFTADFLNEYIKNKNIGHLQIIVDLINHFNSLKSVLEKKTSKKPTEYILDYVVDVIYKYTKNNKFDKLAYMNEIYLKNTDIWGFLTIYTELYNIVSSKKKINSHDLVLLAKIKKIIMENLFFTSTTPINISSLVNQLLDLNSAIKKTESLEKIGGYKRKTYNSKKNKKKNKIVFTLKKNKNNKNKTKNKNNKNKTKKIK